MKKPPQVTCACCQGSGIAPLTDHLWATLQRVKKAKRATVADLQEDGITSTAINNRLTALERLGLVERDGKDGRNIVWRVKP